MLHAWLSEPDPEQVTPPLEGAGLLQSLVLDWDPPPQVALQVPQAVQDPQVPSVGHNQNQFGGFRNINFPCPLHISTLSDCYL